MALQNQALSQAESLFKAAITLVQEVPSILGTQLHLCHRQFCAARWKALPATLANPALTAALRRLGFARADVRGPAGGLLPLPRLRARLRAGTPGTRPLLLHQGPPEGPQRVPLVGFSHAAAPAMDYYFYFFFFFKVVSFIFIAYARVQGERQHGEGEDIHPHVVNVRSARAGEAAVPNRQWYGEEDRHRQRHGHRNRRRHTHRLIKTQAEA